MDAAAGVTVARGVSMPMSTSSQPSRKEWRVVSEQSARNPTSETVSDGQQMPIHNQFPLQAEQISSVAVSSYDYEASVNGKALSSNYFDANISRGIEPNSMVPPPNKEGQNFIASFLCDVRLVLSNFQHLFSAPEYVIKLKHVLLCPKLAKTLLSAARKALLLKEAIFIEA
ncbi:unnamed protein product [Fraxinus pennsylvanica]|uniref:Uncharacterized protein n=1 Tax=Fraxinus pennsylvanica TaxID=56036 RepID=A0AAD2E116_9LAMI|nr:unnamed protein product [Fraxinus pennsylvanica]